ncbi:hypothetical protein KR018_000734 [Drosophila ironensis]|nr:hypothetical protein KR018_000734 [Drosophila ironensis]
MKTDMEKPENSPDIFAHLLKRHEYRYPEDGSHKKWIKPHIMVLYANGNINAVTQAIVNDLVHPIGTGLVATLLVEEPIREEVIKKLRASLKPMDERVQRHPNYLKTVKLIDRMNCSTIHLEDYDELDTAKSNGRRKEGSPIIVLDFPQYYFGAKPTAVITMSTFRNFIELIRLYKRERLDFHSVSVWSSKLAQCFDLVTRIPQTPHWMFNCRKLPLPEPVWTANFVPGVKLNGAFHYETHFVGGKIKSIGFPIE